MEERRFAAAADRELAALVLKQIETDPGSYNQHIWASKLSAFRQRERGTTCGTSMCVAGWAVQISDPLSSPQFIGDTRTSVVQLHDGTVTEYRDAGRKALGLDQRQAAYLFQPRLPMHAVIAALIEIRDTGTLTVPEEL